MTTPTEQIRHFRVAEDRHKQSYMLTWQSADGLPKIEYCVTFEQASFHWINLNHLGRKPKIWADLDTKGLGGGE